MASRTRVTKPAVGKTPGERRPRFPGDRRSCSWPAVVSEIELGLGSAVFPRGERLELGTAPPAFRDGDALHRLPPYIVFCASKANVVARSLPSRALRAKIMGPAVSIRGRRVGAAFARAPSRRPASDRRYPGT